MCEFRLSLSLPSIIVIVFFCHYSAKACSAEWQLGKVISIDCRNDADVIRAAKLATGRSIRVNFLNPIVLKHRGGERVYSFGSQEKPALSVELNFGKSGHLYSDAKRSLANMFSICSQQTLITNPRVTGFQGYGAVFKNNYQQSQSFKVTGGVVAECCNWPNSKEKWSTIFGGQKLVKCDSEFDGITFTRCANDNYQHSHVIYLSSHQITIKNCKFINCGQPIDCLRSLDSKMHGKSTFVGAEANFYNNTVISHGAHNWNSSKKEWTKCHCVFLLFGSRKYKIFRNTIIGDFDHIFQGNPTRAKLETDSNSFEVDLKKGVFAHDWKTETSPASDLTWSEWRAKGHDLNSTFKVRTSQKN